MKQLERT